jgi:hypothetical protein
VFVRPRPMLALMIILALMIAFVAHDAAGER